MDYPLIIDGQLAGALRVWQQGLYTYMEACTRQRRDMLRLWVQGDGQEQYLGLMQPVEGGMSLRRKLTKREMDSFPRQIEFATDRQGVGSDRDRLWQRQSDGSLLCKEESLLAIPAQLTENIYGADIRNICGSQYLVFKY